MGKCLGCMLDLRLSEPPQTVWLASHANVQLAKGVPPSNELLHPRAYRYDRCFLVDPHTSLQSDHLLVRLV